MSAKTIIHSTLAAVALTAATFTATATIGASEAEARRVHVRIAHVHRHVHYPRYYRTVTIAPIAAAAYVGPCHWLKLKTLNTGSPYWYARYRDCRAS